jgi:hypothetical protein
MLKDVTDRFSKLRKGNALPNLPEKGQSTDSILQQV